MAKAGMARKDSDSDGNSPVGASSPKIAVTYMIPANVEKNIAVYCAVNGCSKTEFVTNAIARALREKGLDPNKAPKISY